MAEEIHPSAIEAQAPVPAPAGQPRRRSRLRLILFPIALAVMGIVVTLGIMLAKGNQTLGEVKLHPYPAPNFNMALFGGGQFSLAQQRGKVVVVNFWASWCVPCQTEAPILEQAWQRYRSQGVVLVGVDIKDTPEDARSFLERYGISYPNGFDAKKEIYINYGVYGLPETFVVNRQGLVIHHLIGATTAAQLDGWLAPLLLAKRAQP